MAKKRTYPVGVADIEGHSYTARFDTMKEKREYLELKEKLNAAGFKYGMWFASEGFWPTAAWKLVGRHFLLSLASATMMKDAGGNPCHEDAFGEPRHQGEYSYLFVYVGPFDEEWELGEPPLVDGDFPEKHWQMIFNNAVEAADFANRFIPAGKPLF
ncbi:hypothetical protein LCGC14_0232400 [marine sediment metagenome]|uniref:Uncharacterized protein n=1 Tax=marine sediment metagenome TaxID=412755 RepID=A0A0F9UEM5_9ZZZZ